MPLLKIIGLFLILAGGVGCGYAMCLQLSGRYQELKELQRMVSFLAGEISYGNTPLPEAFKTVSHKVQKPLSTFLEKVAVQLQKSTRESLREVFKEELSAYKMHSNLSSKDMEHLAHLGETLGYLDKDMQLGTLKLYREELEQEMADTYESMTGKKKLYGSLGIMGGLFLVILLL